MKPTARGDQFDQFWAIYPRRVGRLAALREWQRLRPDSDLSAVIVAAVQAQLDCRDWVKDGGRWIPHPRTWLHQGRWQDDLAPVAPRERIPWYKECAHEPKCQSLQWHTALLLKVKP